MLYLPLVILFRTHFVTLSTILITFCKKLRHILYNSFNLRLSKGEKRYLEKMYHFDTTEI